MPSTKLPVFFGSVLGGAVIMDYGVKHLRTAFSGSGNTAGSSTSSGRVGTTPKGGYTQETWARALLAAIGAPATQANVTSIVAWEHREGGNWNNTARYNPLNTSQPLGGSSSMGGGSAIQAYTSWFAGLQATVKTLQNGSYNDVLAALKSGKGLSTGSYPGLSTWSNGAYSSV